MFLPPGTLFPIQICSHQEEQLNGKVDSLLSFNTNEQKQLNESLLYCSMQIQRTHFWPSDWRTGFLLRLVACHAVSSCLRDQKCCSLPLVNNIPVLKYANGMIMHIPPDRSPPQTFFTTAADVKNLSYASQRLQCSVAQIVLYCNQSV